MSAAIPASNPVVIDPVPGATFDRWGVPRVSITAHEQTGQVAVMFTAVRGDAAGYSTRPEDRVELALPDLIERFGADPEALQAIQQITAGILLLAGKELADRGIV